MQLTSCSETEVIAELSYEVKFRKPSLFRFMIEGSTNEEMQKFLTTFYSHLQEVRTLMYEAYVNSSIVRSVDLR